MWPSLLEVLLAVLGEQRGERRLLQEGSSNVASSDGDNLPVVNIVGVPSLRKERKKRQNKRKGKRKKDKVK